jgi:hypothetical protein
MSSAHRFQVVDPWNIAPDNSRDEEAVALGLRLNPHTAHPPELGKRPESFVRCVSRMP